MLLELIHLNDQVSGFESRDFMSVDNKLSGVMFEKVGLLSRRKVGARLTVGSLMSLTRMPLEGVVSTQSKSDSVGQTE